MNSTILHAKDVLHGYDKVATLYPYIPSLSHWRAWEYAAYQKCVLNGRILDPIPAARIIAFILFFSCSSISWFIPWALFKQHLTNKVRL